MIVECYKNGLYLNLTCERYHYPFLAWTLNTSMTDVISYRRTESRWKISLQDSRVNDLSVMCFTRDKNFMNQNYIFCCLLISCMYDCQQLKYAHLALILLADMGQDKLILVFRIVTEQEKFLKCPRLNTWNRFRTTRQKYAVVYKDRSHENLSLVLKDVWYFPLQ